MSDTLFERTRELFIGKPLKNLYRNHSASRNKVVLFLEQESGYPKRLGEDFNLSNLIVRWKKVEEFPVVSIERYYEELHITIRRPEGVKDAGV